MSNLGNKEIIANNIKYYMKKFDKDRNDMCRDLNIKYTTLTDWINGKSYPRIDKIELMANYFNISKSALVEDNKKNFKRRGVKIPVLGKVVAGTPIEAIEEILDFEEITPELAATGEFFALQISGRSMEPRMVEGDVVIVKKQFNIENNDTAVILIGGSEATVKKVKKNENGIILIANNPTAYEPHFYSNEEIEKLPLIIIGKVIELRAKF
ncbi:MAG: LexA family transcriptional regulator [Filifactoraceae bacterium]